MSAREKVTSVSNQQALPCTEITIARISRTCFGSLYVVPPSIRGPEKGLLISRVYKQFTFFYIDGMNKFSSFIELTLTKKIHR